MGFGVLKGCDGDGINSCYPISSASQSCLCLSSWGIRLIRGLIWAGASTFIDYLINQQFLLQPT